MGGEKERERAESNNGEAKRKNKRALGNGNTRLSTFESPHGSPTLHLAERERERNGEKFCSG